MITTIDIEAGATCAGPIPAGREITGVRYCGMRRSVALTYVEAADFSAWFGSSRMVRRMPTHWTEGVECVELSTSAPCGLRIEVETLDEEDVDGDGASG